MDPLVTDLERRHKRTVALPLQPGDEMIAVDLLAARNTDVYPTMRIIAIDPATGAGKIRVSTCYPDSDGECHTAEHGRFRRLLCEYVVTAELTNTLKSSGTIITDRAFKGVGPNEFVLNFEWYAKFRTAHPDIEYKTA